MTTYSMTMMDRHLGELSDHLIRPDGCERAAYVLCGVAKIGADPWDGESHIKYLSKKVIVVPDEEIIESSPSSITWKTRSFVSALKEAQNENMVVAIVHNHPKGFAGFSDQDDLNEPDLVQLAVNRNGNGTNMLSLVLTVDGLLAGRVWLAPREKMYAPLRMIRVTGKKLALHYHDKNKLGDREAFNRQALALGKALNEDLSRLRVGVVGVGGTGSATAMLLARLGVGQLCIFDHDIVDRTNLNRLHGARQADADALRSKVETVANSIAEFGLGVRIARLDAWVGDEECRDALKSCDIVFGCTDDNSGRLLLNRLAYYYLIPIFDMGLAIEVNEDVPPSVMCLDGRVTYLHPFSTCLLCRKVIDTELARAEGLRRTNPAEYERQKLEAYVDGEGDPSPAVVTFTTELASMAINEMIHRLQGFRGQDCEADNRVRKFHLMTDRKPKHIPRDGCRICDCQSDWARGDDDLFLGLVG